MKTPIPLPVKSVHVRHTESGKWAADVTFGIPDDSAHDDPTITITSGEGMESPPKAGDILMVRPPEIIGHAYVQAVQDGADEHIVLIQQRDEAREIARELRDALALMVLDLPRNRDWLNPDTEKIAKAILEQSKEVLP